ncbi:MAG: winged helix-turn-helix transcriptional regulator [Candidatus Latescibacterota bacterium]|nr:winged helix-turn-helix transcriptional regulator [Candidatus Latescibacterota bacterium]MEE2727435.1 winged helix-turn-helix transcriptional regulator [Candidatus Latescibacterota bacterium]
MTMLDEQEQLIMRALVRNPRSSDNRISALTGVPVRTVSRKRARLERDGVLTYYTGIETQAAGTGRFTTQHMLLIKFKLGITRSQIVQEIRSEPNVANVFSELIRDSYIAEMDGHIALVMVVEGESNSDVADNVQGKIIPSLQKNHGEDSIQELRTIRLLAPIRRLHNYLPMVNMEEGFIRQSWPDDAIFVE